VRARQGPFAAEQGSEALARKGGRVDDYAAAKVPADLRALEGANRDLTTALDKLRVAASDNASERAQDAQMVAGVRGLDSAFATRVQPAAGTSGFDAAVKPYQAQEARIADQLASYARARQAEARAGAAAAH